MDATVIILLISTGIFVGIVNTFAGGAAVISLALFGALGLSPTVANGTMRLPVLFQTMTMSVSFRRQGVLDYRTGLKLAIPTLIGAIIGTKFATSFGDSVMTVMLSSVLLLLLVTLVFNPTKMLQRNITSTHRNLRVSDYIWFLIIGLYGGCFHVGVGYFILAAVIIGMGYNLIEANAMKGFIVMIYAPVSLAIFMIDGQVAIAYGLVHSIGNIAGSYLAVRYSDRIGLNVLRVALIVVTVVTILDLMKVISLANVFNDLFKS